MQKSLHLDPDKCTGCLQCEMACSFENYGVFNPAKSRIKVFEFHDIEVTGNADYFAMTYSMAVKFGFGPVFKSPMATSACAIASSGVMPMPPAMNSGATASRRSGKLLRGSEIASKSPSTTSGSRCPRSTSSGPSASSAS